MKRTIPVTILASILFGAIGAAYAAAPVTGQETAIHFANSGGIYDYRATDDLVLHVQSRDKSWYKVQLVGPCSGLTFATGIGFEADSSGDFTKFSKVVVGDQKCSVTSVVAIEGQPPKGK